MNNPKSIKQVLGEYVIKSNAFHDFKIKNIYSQIQNQTLNSIVMINVTDKYPSDFFKKKEHNQVCYITNKEVGFDCEIVIKKDSYPEVKKILCDLIYPPNKKTKIIGITGTNGKTSTAFYVNQMFAISKLNSLYVGTIGIYEGLKKISKFHQTTPDYIEIRKDLNKAYDYLIYEVSSHGLEQNRFYDLKFEAAAWTSFSQDHLDYHKTMENYFKAKLKILNHLENDKKCFVYNKQKDLLKMLKDEKKVKSVTATQKYLNYFSEVNITLALSIFHFCEPGKEISTDQLLAPPGRFEQLSFKSNIIIIDYAHTPDALEHLLEQVKKSFKQELLLIFGCGGDRDPTKRPLMGKIAEKYADIIFITEDNNRRELFSNIAKDIESGMKNSPIKIPLRLEAISKACLEYQDKVIVIAGKGHEDTMETNNGLIHFNDLETIRELENGSI